jgi:c-di-GMP-binding flagellar brake protein YcgR
MESKGRLFLEKREQKRFSKHFVIHYKIMPKNVAVETARTQGKSLDISLGGIRIEGEAAGQPGDIMRIEIFGRDFQDNVTVLAEIRWVNKKSKNYEFGVKFVGVREEEEFTLEELLTK